MSEGHSLLNFRQVTVTLVGTKLPLAKSKGNDVLFLTELFNILKFYFILFFIVSRWSIKFCFMESGYILTRYCPN